MNAENLKKYWADIPTGQENAFGYEKLCDLWSCEPRKARLILQELSIYDNGDDFVLIRSSGTKGFYKTDNPDQIEAYRRECLSKGRSVLAPIKKCNRILNVDSNARQVNLFNNLRSVRLASGFKQTEVCAYMKSKGETCFDVGNLSRCENGVLLPTPKQLAILAEMYGVKPSELLSCSNDDYCGAV